MTFVLVRFPGEFAAAPEEPLDTSFVFLSLLRWCQMMVNLELRFGHSRAANSVKITKNFDDVTAMDARTQDLRFTRNITQELLNYVEFRAKVKLL
ncbi:hypothetical protein AVEN_228833-1 [Araneus ventricosus]|uniref:Uncharacterized protein n=2 Tax=Araneus ventricosus TaxID=182803 RepID=A0A4Y2X8X8_ARAVE|nr:hypothetical protein AVEN_228833-1 [Araneus ventricosus]